MQNKDIKDMNNEYKSCDICTESFNKISRKKVVCSYESCQKLCCKTCFCTYLKDCGVTPSCMWCKKDLSLDFIYENVTQKFYEEYKDYRARILVEREESTLPQLQDRADQILRSRKYDKEIVLLNPEFHHIKTELLLEKEDLKELYKKFEISGKKTPYDKMSDINIFNEYSWLLNERCNLCDRELGDRVMGDVCKSCNLKTCIGCIKLCLLLNDAKCVMCDTQPRENIFELVTKTYYNKFFKPKKRRQNSVEMEPIRVQTIQKIKNKLKINESLLRIYLVLYKTRTGIDHLERQEREIEEEKKERKHFIKKCFNNDCRGFISNAWKCGLCNDYFCPDCHKKKNSRNDEDHVCDENEKLTVAHLKNDSKPCPNCGMPIQRISGCSQVWTPCCKIAFDWNTGKIDKGRVHSPELYDYLRRNGGVIPREVGDDVCGGNVDYIHIRNAFSPSFWKTLMYEYILECNRYMQHISEVVLPTLPNRLGVQDNSDLGVKYLVGDIDKDKWIKTLKIRVKKEEKNNNIYNILNMFVTVMNDLFRNLIETKNSKEFKMQVGKLTEYTNEQIERILKRYKSKDKQFFVNIRDMEV